MMRPTIHCAANGRFTSFILSTLLCLQLPAQAQPDLAAWVDPRIGTSNDGNTHVGAVVPWGLASMAPRNTLKRPDAYIPVNYYGGGRWHYGISPVNLSGVGCPDWGTPYLMPGHGALRWEAPAYGQQLQTETAEAGLYANTLADGIRTQATATQRSGMLDYRFPKADSNWIVLDLGPGLGPLDGAAVLRVVPRPQGVQVWVRRQQGSFCGRDNRSQLYLALDVEAPVAEVVERRASVVKPYSGDTSTATHLALGIRLQPGVQQAAVRVGVSFVRAENAEANRRAEQSARSFADLRRAARTAWNQVLQRVQLQGGPDSLKRICYTALYHILLHPSVLSDVNGDYPLPGGGTGRAQGYTRYTVFSLWDTYRNVHNLLALLYPEQQADMLRTLMAFGRESGHLPKWELGGQESFVMVGDPAPIVLADSWAMGIRPFAASDALALARAGSTRNDLRSGNAAYRQYGYIPQDQKNTLGVWGSVSTTLEYNLSDDAIRRLALAAGDTAAARAFETHSMGWTKLYDPTTGMLRPRMADGSWLQPFNPDTVGGELDWYPSGGPGYVEGNAWHYRFFVPHAVPQLIERLGGPKRFVNALAQTFDERHFVLWNEPDMAYPYLFGYVPGEAWRIAPTVDSLRRRYFRLGIAGLPGNDDCGTLSAWLLFSSLGLYPDCPGTGRYMLGTPAFGVVRLQLDRRYHPGREIVIRAVRSQPGAIHPQRVRWNKSPHTATQISATALRSGGELVFELADRPGQAFQTVLPGQ